MKIKDRLRNVLESFDAQLSCWAYHKLLHMVTDGQQTLIKSIERTKTQGKVPSVPWKRIVISCVIFVLLYYVGVPSNSVTNGHLDSTIWVGFMSLITAISIGLMATADWLSSTLRDMMIGVFLEALGRKLITESQMQIILSETDFSKEHQENLNVAKRKVEHSETASLVMGQGAFMLILLIVVMPLPIWVSYRIEAGLVGAIVAWVLGTLFTIPGIIWILPKSSVMMAVFCQVRDKHEKVKPCPYCNILGSNEKPSEIKSLM